MVQEIVIQDEDRTMNCFVENNEKGGGGDITCNIYNQSWLSLDDIRELEPDDKAKVDRIRGKNLELSVSGKKKNKYVIVRD